MAFLAAHDTDFCAEQENFVVYEKNTFLAFEAVPRSQRKRTSSSVPAEFKVAALESTFASVVQKRDIASLPKVVSSETVSSVTTKYFSDSDACSDSDSATWGSEAQHVAEEEAHGGKAAAAPAKMRLSDLIAPPSVAALPIRGRPRLTTKARAFVSTSVATTKQPWERHEFRAQVELIMAAVQSAMLSMGLLASVCASSTAGSWSVCARVMPGLESCSSILLTGAKRALVKGVEQSKNIYMLGYLADPFADNVNGTTATLCGMEDEKAACWDYYSKGFCHRGCACKWAHPTFQMTVSVEVRR